MDHVIIGNGPAGVIAAETLRRTDPSSTVTLIGDEPEPPYSRMAIPYLLAENVGEEGTHLRHGEGPTWLTPLRVTSQNGVTGAPAGGAEPHVDQRAS